MLFFFLLILQPPTSPLFPYTTLFRSIGVDALGHAGIQAPGCDTHPPADRSEEHTSELQSRVDLVCRHRLEKKINCLFLNAFLVDSINQRKGMLSRAYS